jgi:hypothetical protein
VACLSIHSRQGQVGGRTGDLRGCFLCIVRVCSEGVDGQLVKPLLGHSKTFNTQSLEIDLAIDDAPSQGFPAPPLDDVHTQRGDANGCDENGQDDD